MLPILTAIFPVITEVLDRLIPDKAAAARAATEMQMKLIDAANQGALAQIEVNKVEAANPSVFVSGWRPMVGWVCAMGVFWAFLGQPLANWAVVAFGVKVAAIPVLPTDNLMELVFAMLGIGGLRTFEKIKGVAK